MLATLIVSANGAIVSTGKARAEIPLTSFGKNDKGLVVSITKADLDDALAAADRAWPEWRSTDVEKRGAILHKVAALLRERADHIGAILTQEQGKILAEANAEVLGSAQLFDWYAEEIKRDYGRTLVRPAGQLSRVIRQPVGPTATFSPNLQEMLMAGVAEIDTLVCSTGRIGVQLPMENVKRGILAAAKIVSDSRAAAANFAEAIMTSDSRAKEIAVELALGGKKVRIGGVCKGAGMIQPGMSPTGARPASALHATMLGFVTTDCEDQREGAEAELGNRGGAELQSHHSRWRHEHERHRAGARQRPLGHAADPPQ